MNKRIKEKRFLDEDDLTGIECTFKDIRHELKETSKAIRHELKEIRVELKHNRDVNDIREKANDIRYYTLLAVISFFGILLSIFKVLF